MVSKKEMRELGLMAVLDKLKEEIQTIQADATSKKMFKLNDVEIALALAVDFTVKGGLNIWVINFGGEKAVKQAHTVTLKLKPLEGMGPLMME